MMLVCDCKYHLYACSIPEVCEPKLRSQNDKDEKQAAAVSSNSSRNGENNNPTSSADFAAEEAACPKENTGTLASVEDQLRLLKHQHAEAEQRMTKLAQHVQGISEKPISIDGEVFQVTAGYHSDKQGGVSGTANLTEHMLPESSKNVQTNINFGLLNIAGAAQTKEDTKAALDISNTSPLYTTEMPTPGKFWLDISDQNFKALENDTSVAADDTESAVSFMLSDVTSIQSPKFVQQQEAVLSKIRQTQMSLEDRISQLNQQHSQAQSRLHRLVAKRKNSFSKQSNASKLTDSMFETPSKPGKACSPTAASTVFNDSSSCWFPLSNDNDTSKE